jgi:hypothetical protein
VPARAGGQDERLPRPTPPARGVGRPRQGLVANRPVWANPAGRRSTAQRQPRLRIVPESVRQRHESQPHRLVVGTLTWHSQNLAQPEADRECQPPAHSRWQSGDGSPRLPLCGWPLALFVHFATQNYLANCPLLCTWLVGLPALAGALACRHLLSRFIVAGRCMQSQAVAVQCRAAGVPAKLQRCNDSSPLPRATCATSTSNCAVVPRPETAPPRRNRRVFPCFGPGLAGAWWRFEVAAPPFRPQIIS